MRHLSHDNDSAPMTWPQNTGELARLVDRYADRLLTYACRRLGDLHEAEDVVQEVFLRILKERAPRRDITNMGAYLYRMATNACIDQKRRASRRPPHVSDEAVGDITHSAPDPMRLLAAKEETQRIEALLRALPPEQAETVRLRVFAELSLAEIAEIEGCGVNTVNSRLRYAFAKLREIVEQEAKS